MEKSERRKTAPSRCRLLKFSPRLCAFFLFTAVCTLPLCAFDVDIFVSSFEILTGQELVLEFTVYNANPADTSLESPSFPSTFTQTSTRKERRRIEKKGGVSGSSANATVISQKWVPSEPGNYSLGPFTVRLKDETVQLPPVYVTVTAPEVAGFAGLRWVPSSDQAHAGAPIRITLEYSLKGTIGALTCEAPETALLEPLPLLGSGTARKTVGSSAVPAVPAGIKAKGSGSVNPVSANSPAVSGTPAIASGSSAGMTQEDGHVWIPVAVWNWTPLAAGECQLPVAVLEYTTLEGESRKIASQPCSVQVAKGAPDPSSAGIPRTVGKAFTPPEPEKAGEPVGKSVRSVPPFPAALSAASGKTVFSVASAFWKKANYRESLAALRHAEYTALFPAAYRAVRLSCEGALGLGDTLSVPPAAWKPFAVIGAVVFLCLGLILHLAGMHSRVSGHFSYLLFFASFALAIFAVFVYTRDLKPAGVVSQASLLHVPENSSTIVETLPEGTAIRILRKAGDWAYVETPSSLRGWLRYGQILEYTKTEQP